jgi:U3 small nucleolar RNA-associated protein 7
LEKQREEKRRALAATVAGETGEEKKPSALDRFKKAK